MIYWDCDGVLFKYDYSMYDHIYGEPDWNEVGSHAFLRCEPDPFAQEITKRISAQMPDDQAILTAVDGRHGVNARNEQIFDKMTTIAKYYPWLNLCNFMACESEKRNAIGKIKGMRLTKSDILIDDYKKNLSAWRNAGGTAVKYVNGINSIGDWPGPYIDATFMAEEEAVEILMKIWYESC